MGAKGSGGRLKNLRDPLWRLRNLYAIKDAETGRVMPFVPRPEQTTIFEALHTRKLRRIIILKARRLGMSTAIDIAATDLALWNAGYQVSIVDRTQDDASKKLSNICKVAIDAVPDDCRATVIRDNDSSVELGLADTMSAVYAGKNARGGTNQFLHLSEWGVIQHDDPARSQEILTGAVPSAEHGVIVVETTWKGGNGGHLWELVKWAMETPDSEKTADDWHLFFFPWWRDPTYTHDGNSAVDSATEKYCDDLQLRIGQPITHGQRQWYARRRRENGIFIYREFPSTIEECWKSPIEGAVYAGHIERARAEGRICSMPIDGSNFVNTSWDLGSPENTVVWYWQIVGREIRMIDCDRGDKGTLMERVAGIVRKGYNLGKHYLPHDAQQTERTGTTMATELAKLLPGVVTVPRVHDVWIGINHMLELFPAISFRSPHCDDGLTALAAYRTRREGEGATQTDLPVHDWSSHTADAARTMAEAHRAGMVSFKHTTAEPRLDWYVPGVSPFRVHQPGPAHRVRRGAKPMRLM